MTFRSTKGPKMGGFLPLFDRNVLGIGLLEGHIDAYILRARQRGKRRYVVEAGLDFWRDGDGRGHPRGLGQFQLGPGPLRWGRTGCWCRCGRWRADGDGFYLWCWGLDGRGYGRWCLGYRFWFSWGGSNGGGVAEAVDRLGQGIRLPGRRLGRGGRAGFGARSGFRLGGSAGRQWKAGKNDKKTARCHGNPP